MNNYDHLGPQHFYKRVQVAGRSCHAFAQKQIRNVSVYFDMNEIEYH